jgi:hypothetical protein
MDDIHRRFSMMRWSYAEGDPQALGELESRIAGVGRARKLITYSELVQRVRFDLPNLKESPRYIDIHAWQGLDRAHGAAARPLHPPQPRPALRG